MNNLLFSPRRKPYEWLLLALGVAAVAAFFFLEEYRFKPVTVDDFRQQTNRIVDSVIAANGYDRDTLNRFARLSVDEELSAVVADSLGSLRTHRYLQEHRLQEVLFEVYLVSESSQSFNITFFNSDNNRRRSRSSDDAGGIMRIFFDGDTHIVGVQKRQIVPAADSATLFAALRSMVPATYPDAANWTIGRYEPDTKLLASSLLDSNALWKRFLRLEATHPSQTADSTWQLRWQETVEPTAQPQMHHTPVYSTVISYVQFVFPLLIFVLIFITTGIFISRLRKKAVSITLCIVGSVIVGLYFFINSFAFMELPVIVYILVVFVYLILAFLFVGIPIAGIFSMIREKYASKFYTLVRLRREPWNSRYVGRSILTGLATALITTVLIMAIYAVAFNTGYEVYFRTLFFNPGLYFLSIQPGYAQIATILFITLLNIILITVFPALTARIPSSRLRFWLSFAGAFLCMMLLPLSQSDEIADALIGGLFSGAIGFLIFSMFDVLSLSVFSFATTVLTMLAMFSSSPLVCVIMGLVLGGLLVLGIKAYASPAETVHEEEYKPEFMYKLEEEKRILQELAAAQSVQKRLLPTVLPRFATINVAATCIPALEVGGDYYDFFQLDDRRLGVLIGDVSGKGMSAAFYITLAKGVIVSQIHQAGTPADVLRRVNALVYGVMERGKFISLIYGIFDTDTNEFTYANAGHNPLLLRHPDTTTEYVQTRGMAIGLDNGKIFDAVIRNHTLTLRPGSVLLLYTDGVTEAMNYDGHEYGEERLRAVVSRSPAGADNVVSTLISGVMQFIGKAKQHDDITAVAVEVLPMAAGALTE